MPKLFGRTTRQPSPLAGDELQTAPRASAPHAPAARRARRSLRAAAAAALAAALGALALAAPAPAAPLSAADQAFVDAVVEDAVRANGVGGMSIWISGPAGDYARAYGDANGTTRTALTLGHHFRIASITKTFTATAVLKLIEQGELSFDDTLDEFVPDIPYGDQITVRHLLSMRAGLFNYQRDAGLLLHAVLTPWAAIEPEQLIDVLRKPGNRPHFAPGTATEYSETAYVLLGKIIEEVTGEDVEDVIDAEVIQPLGLRSTIFPSAANTRPIYGLPSPYATGYARSVLIPNTIQDMTAFNPNLVWTAGAVISTIGDLATYVRELGTGSLLSSAMHDERQRFCPLPYSLGGPSEFGYGLGLMSFGRWIGHNGSVAGFGSAAFYEPQTGAVIVGLENFQSANIKVFSEVFAEIAEHLYPGSLDQPRYPTC